MKRIPWRNLPFHVLVALLISAVQAQTVTSSAVVSSQQENRATTSSAGSLSSYSDARALSPADVASERNYNQQLRPQFHYTALQGHIGDATGLVYYGGEYHLFNIFDEWSRQSAAHKRWGHATSQDLVHWTQQPALLETDIDHSPGSGSAVVDWNNSSGLRQGQEKAILLFYTDYQSGSHVLYSNDRGKTWTRYKNNPVVAGAEDMRDPNVFWYKPSGDWRMIRYEKRGFAFYRSSDLLHWQYLSRISGFYECPDLFQLKVENDTTNSRWVLVDGDGSYFLGNFDGVRFVPEGSRKRVEFGKAFYASQTWKTTAAGSLPVQIAWLKYPKSSVLTWDGQMSFPVALRLLRVNGELLLARAPIPAIEDLRTSRQVRDGLALGSGTSVLEITPGALIDLSLKIRPIGATEFGLLVNGTELRYSIPKAELSLGADTAPLPMNGKTLDLRVLIDHSSVEVFANDGLVTISAITLPNSSTPVSFKSNGNVVFEHMEMDELESIWPHH